MPSFKLATSSTKLSYAVAKFFKTSSLKLASLLDCFIFENSWCETLLKERFIDQINIAHNIFIVTLPTTYENRMTACQNYYKFTKYAISSVITQYFKSFLKVKIPQIQWVSNTINNDCRFLLTCITHKKKKNPKQI